MPGSKDDFVYYSDDGKSYAVTLDESNARAMGFEDVKDDGSNVKDGALPKGLKMRYVLFRSEGGKIQRKLYAPKPNSPKYINGGSVTLTILTGATNNVAQAVTLYSTYRRGESAKLIAAAGAGSSSTKDTGLTDEPQKDKTA